MVRIFQTDKSLREWMAEGYGRVGMGGGGVLGRQGPGSEDIYLVRRHLSVTLAAVKLCKMRPDFKTSSKSQRETDKIVPDLRVGMQKALWSWNCMTVTETGVVFLPTRQLLMAQSDANDNSPKRAFPPWL